MYICTNQSIMYELFLVVNLELRSHGKGLQISSLTEKYNESFLVYGPS